MNNYKYIAQKLLQLLGPNMAIRITSEGYMPLLTIASFSSTLPITFSKLLRGNQHEGAS